MRGLFGALSDGMRRAEVKATDASALTWARILGQESSSKAGVPVGINTALKVSTVFACLRVLANGIAQVPLKLYREGADGSFTVEKDNPIHRMLYRSPNDWMTSFEFRQQMMFHAVLTGTAVAYIGRVRGEPRELVPLIPGTFRLSQSLDWKLTAELNEPMGGRKTLDREEMFILRGPMWSGPAGINALEVARDAIGLAIATEDTHSALHANGAQPGGILSIKSPLSDDGKARLKQSWQDYQAGLRNKFKTAVLDMDASWTAMSATGVDNQHLETRRFQIEEICRDLGVNPLMVYYSDKTATYAAAEAFRLGFVVSDLGPWVENWQQSLARDLFPKDVDLAAKFSLQGLLRGDHAARSAFYAAGIVNGWMTRNEARRLEDLNPIAGLDDPLLPLNMGTQSERDDLAKGIADEVKAMLGHNGGPSIDDADLEMKIGRVLSATNERRIIAARDSLSEVLDSIKSGQPKEEELKSAPPPPEPPQPIVVNVHSAPVTVSVDGQTKAKTRKTVESYDDDGRIKTIIEEEVE